MEKETPFSPEDSLKLIETMIGKTKESVADNSFYFLLWGWLVFFCCITQFMLKVWIHFSQHAIVWWLMPVGGLVSWLYGAKTAKSQHVKSFVGESVIFLWNSLAIAFVVIIFINMGSNNWGNAFAYYLLLYAIGTFTTGSLLHFRPLIIGGIINFILATVAVRFSFDYQLLIGALGILTSYIIPGHLLRARTKKQS